MGWDSLNDLLRRDTEEEADWAAKHAPNTSKAPRGWRPVAFIPEDVAALQEGEARKDQVARLGRAGYQPMAVALTLDISVSRVQQIYQEERKRVGAVQA